MWVATEYWSAEQACLFIYKTSSVDFDNRSIIGIEPSQTDRDICCYRTYDTIRSILLECIACICFTHQ